MSFEKCLQKTFCKNSATNCEKDRPTHAYKSGASEEASQKRCQEGKKEKESILRINRYVFSVFSKRSRKIRYISSPNNAVSTSLVPSYADFWPIYANVGKFHVSCVSTVLLSQILRNPFFKGTK